MIIDIPKSRILRVLVGIFNTLSALTHLQSFWIPSSHKGQRLQSHHGILPVLFGQFPLLASLRSSKHLLPIWMIGRQIDKQSVWHRKWPSRCWWWSLTIYSFDDVIGCDPPKDNHLRIKSGCGELSRNICVKLSIHGSFCPATHSIIKIINKESQLSAVYCRIPMTYNNYKVVSSCSLVGLTWFINNYVYSVCIYI